MYLIIRKEKQMKFDKKQKIELKELGLWPRVKQLVKKSAEDYKVRTVGKGSTLGNSFSWNDTAEGHTFWDIVNRRLKRVSK